MPAIVSALRCKRAWSYELRCLVMPCRQDYRAATPTRARLIIDTGSARSQLHRQAAPGLTLAPTTYVFGIGGHRTPAAKMRAHFVFAGGDGELGQLLTATVLLIDAPSTHEDGLLGIDLVRGMTLRAGTVVATLARDDATAQGLMSSNATSARLHRAVGLLAEQAEAGRCGCYGVLAGVRP